MQQVEIFITCMIDQFFPSVGWSMVKVLEKLDCEVKYNPNQTCCGMPGYYRGHRESTKEVATKFLEDFNSKNKIVAPSAACVNMVANSYDTFFKNTSNHNVYRGLQSRVFELSDFLINDLKVKELPSVFNKKVAYHHHCLSLNTLGLESEPLQLLQMVKGLQLVHTQAPGFCCGYGGDFAANNETEAVERANKLMDIYEKAGAEVVVSNDYNCLFHFESITKKSGRNISFMHLAEVLAQGF
ncbi:Fe-S oxidoreductase [bacterium]|nr:Fe-S oxidoreductase [bacterium]